MKKPVKKTPARRQPSKPSHHKWTVFWIRTVYGDEYVSYAKPMRTGIMMMDPTIVTSYADQMILAPYGMMSKEPGILLQHQHVAHYNEASDSMREFYESSVATSLEFVKLSFEKVVKKSLETTIKVSQMDEEPSAEGVVIGRAHELEFGMGDSNMEDFLNQAKSANSVDNLVKLAERAGKGKKIN